MRYHVMSRRDLAFYDKRENPSHIQKEILNETDRIREARGFVKQQINSHLDMLAHHDYFDLTFHAEEFVDLKTGNLPGQTLWGEDDDGVVRYQYSVWVEEHA